MHKRINNKVENLWYFFVFLIQQKKDNLPASVTTNYVARIFYK